MKVTWHVREGWTQYIRPSPSLRTSFLVQRRPCEIRTRRVPRCVPWHLSMFFSVIDEVWGTAQGILAALPCRLFALLRFKAVASTAANS